ncbi:MAG: hypothetical protein ACW968_12965 [Candidatus Thorarchaeota archaeon]|jgi:hypothetical protein
MNTTILVFFVLATAVAFVYGLKKSSVAKTTVTRTKNLMQILTLKSDTDPDKEDLK